MLVNKINVGWLCLGDADSAMAGSCFDQAVFSWKPKPGLHETVGSHWYSTVGAVPAGSASGGTTVHISSQLGIQ